jgi:hypothetical protein
MNAVVPLKQRVLAAAAATPSPTRRQDRRLRAGLLALSLLAGIGLLELVGGIAQPSARPPGVTVRLADGWALASTLLTWLMLRRKDGLLLAFPRALLFATLACPVMLFAWMARFHGTFPEPSPTPDWACLAFTLAGAATPLGSFLTLYRGIELERPDLLGAAAGAAAGAWSGVLALLWCPTTSPWHVLLGHVAPIAILTCVGSILGAWMLGLPLRRRPRAGPAYPLFAWPFGRMAMKRAPRAAPSRVSTMIGRM